MFEISTSPEVQLEWGLKSTGRTTGRTSTYVNHTVNPHSVNPHVYVLTFLKPWNAFHSEGAFELQILSDINLISCLLDIPFVDYGNDRARWVAIFPPFNSLLLMTVWKLLVLFDPIHFKCNAQKSHSLIKLRSCRWLLFVEFTSRTLCSCSLSPQALQASLVRNKYTLKVDVRCQIKFKFYDC